MFDAHAKVCSSVRAFALAPEHRRAHMRSRTIIQIKAREILAANVW